MNEILERLAPVDSALETDRRPPHRPGTAEVRPRADSWSDFEVRIWIFNFCKVIVPFC